MKTKVIKRKVNAGVSKKKSKQFDLDKFLLEAFGAEPGHFSFDEIQEFARSGSRGKSEFAAIKTHVDTCERCKSIYDDIVRFDPFLSVGEPIPEGFWKKFWETLEAELPENVRKALAEASDEAKSTMSQTVDTLLVDYFASLEDRIIKYNSYEDSRQRKEFLRSIRTLQQNACTEFVDAFWQTMQNCNNQVLAKLGFEGELKFSQKPNLTFVTTDNRSRRHQDVVARA